MLLIHVISNECGLTKPPCFYHSIRRHTLFITPINKFVTDVIEIKDDLIALVSFQTLVNIIGITLFYPLLNIFARLLEKRFKEKESRHFLDTVLDFSWSCFEKKK